MIKTKFDYKTLYVFFLIVYIVCLPLNAINIGSFGSAIRVVAFLPIALAILGSRSFKISTPVLAQFLFSFFAFFSIIWTVSLGVTIDRIISYFLLFSLVFSGTSFKFTDQEINKIKIAMIWSSRVTAIIVLLLADIVEGRLWLKNSIIVEDPNYICTYYACGIVFCISLLTKKTSISKKVIAILELLLYFYLILASGSRGGLLAALTSVIVYLITFSKKNVFKRILVLTIILVILITLIDFLPDDLKNRFTVDNVVESGGTGRINLWKQSIDLFANSNLFRKLFGYGTATIMWCFEHFGYIDVNVVHNMFLETLAELGIIGFLLYTWAIFAFIKSASGEKDKFALAVISCMFVLSLSTSIYTFKPYFNIMLFIVIQNNLQRSDSDKNDLIQEVKND